MNSHMWPTGAWTSNWIQAEALFRARENPVQSISLWSFLNQVNSIFAMVQLGSLFTYVPLTHFVRSFSSLLIILNPLLKNAHLPVRRTEGPSYVCADFLSENLF